MAGPRLVLPIAVVLVVALALLLALFALLAILTSHLLRLLLLAEHVAVRRAVRILICQK